jgi:hypothetical protein
VAARDARRAIDEPQPIKPKKEKPTRSPKRTGPTELETLEAEISAREAEISNLEAKLAEDWADVDVVAAHRRARDELQELLGRWEQLFERA